MRNGQRIGTWTRWTMASVLAISGIAVSAQTTWARPAATQPAAGKAHADKGEQKHDADHFKQINTILADLSLTPDQQTKVNAIEAEFGKATAAWHSQHKSELSAVADKAKAAKDASDKAASKSAAAERKQIMAGAPKLSDAAGQIRTVLTPEQQTKFDAKVAELTPMRKKDGAPKPASAEAKPKRAKAH